jgi:predicted metal-dependent hydrolase
MGIVVRRVQFEFAEDLAAHWHASRPEWSQVVNAASLLMPYLEPFLIEAIREAIPQLRDPVLAQEARGYVGQEAHHFRQHRRFNDRLVALGYEGIRSYETQLEREYEALSRETLAFRLAYAAGFETMALAMGHYLIRDRVHLFAGADPAVTSLVLWHFVEELEHKHAAFGVYQAVAGGYWLRVRGLAYAIWHTLSRTREAYRMLLRRDGLWVTWRSRVELKLVMLRLFGYVTPWILEALSPWHDPARLSDPEWARDWMRLYQAGEPRLLRLDTARIGELPRAICS